MALHLALLCVAMRTASAMDIGPDAFGYTASNVPYVFEDLSGSGTKVLARTNDEVVSIPLGFTFTFYGVDYTSVSWSTNGLITLGGTNADPGNVDFETAAPAGDHPSIAVLWDDWQFEQPGADGSYYEVRGAPGSRRFLIQWHLAFENPSSPSNVIFQAALFEGSNDILFSFEDSDTATATGFGASATVGIRDTSGHMNGRNLEWSFNSMVIMIREAVRFFAPSDTAPPVVSITAPADGALFSASEVMVTGLVMDESPSTVSSSPAGISAALPAGGGGVSGMVVLVEGLNTIVLSATDSLGNAGGTSITVVRDMTAPAVQVMSPADGATVGDTPASVVVSVVDASASTVSLGSATAQVPSGGGSVTLLADLVAGMNMLHVTAVDAAGNVGMASVTLMLDMSAPLVSIDSPADGASFGPGASPIPVVATVNDASATQVHSTPAGLTASLPAGGGVATGAIALVEGMNDITVMASDATGKSASASIAVRLDTTPPAVTLDSPAAGMALRGMVEVGATATDAGTGVARVDLLLDGRVFASMATAPFATTLDTSLSADGAHTVSAMAFDAKGNSSSARARVVFDNTPPAVTFAAPLEGALVSGDFAFALDASDAGSGLMMVRVLAGGEAPTVDPSASYAPPVSRAHLDGSEDTTHHADGVLALTALAVDAAGNEMLARVNVMVDNTPPGAVQLTPPNGSVVSGLV